MSNLEDNLGTIHEIGCSGAGWGNGIAGSLSDLFYNTLRPEKVKNRVQISTYTLGRKNSEVEEFFEILNDLVIKNKRKVVLIINDDNTGTFHSCSLFAKGKLKELHDKDSEKFQYYFFDSKLHAGKLLHAKLVVVDRKIALIGSANISKKALSSNYEVMLKISGDVVSRLSLMLDNLVEMLKDESNAN